MDIEYIWGLMPNELREGELLITGIVSNN